MEASGGFKPAMSRVKIGRTDRLSYEAMEVRAGIAPARRGFADRCLSAWLPDRGVPAWNRTKTRRLTTSRSTFELQGHSEPPPGVAPGSPRYKGEVLAGGDGVGTQPWNRTTIYAVRERRLAVRRAGYAVPEPGVEPGSSRFKGGRLAIGPLRCSAGCGDRTRATSLEDWDAAATSIPRSAPGRNRTCVTSVKSRVDESNHRAGATRTIRAGV